MERIDFAEKVWRVPAERMKMKQPHAIPLARQVLFLLQDLRSLARDSEFLFPALHTIKRCIFRQHAERRAAPPGVRE